MWDNPAGAVRVFVITVGLVVGVSLAWVWLTGLLAA